MRLAELTTMGVGGEPALIVDAYTREQLVAALADAWEGDWFVLGGGSNLLASDEPFDGTVVRILTTGFAPIDGAPAGYQRVAIEAGQNWDEFVAWTVSSGLQGVEAMSGIPGTAGAAPIQNVGAYGQEIVQTLVSVDLIDVGSSVIETVPAAELGLGPRTSDLKRHYGEEPIRDAVIAGITLDLRVVGTDPAPVADERIRSALSLSETDELTLAQIRERVLAIRASKGMVLDPSDADTRSAGSFFNNPIIAEADARRLPAECPRWPVEEVADAVQVFDLATWDGQVPRVQAPASRVKVSAAWLIEHSGLPKGFSLPGSRAGLSTKHTLAITNRGGASSAEIAELARYVRTRVAAEYGITLNPEPVFVDVEL